MDIEKDNCPALARLPLELSPDDVVGEAGLFRISSWWIRPIHCRGGGAPWRVPDYNSVIAGEYADHAYKPGSGDTRVNFNISLPPLSPSRIVVRKIVVCCGALCSAGIE